MEIGNVLIKHKTVLAPMAGISNPSFFKIVEEMGVGMVVTELLSSEAIIRDNKKTYEMLNGIEKINIPVSIQIFGGNPDTMAKAAKIIEEKYHPSIIDINMGCPVPKVAVRSGAGSALMKDPDRVKEMVTKVVNSVSCPVTVKIRSGWDNESINAVEIAKICEEAGAKAIAVHARTRNQGYTGKADWNIIKQVKENVSIPVIGNGDIVDIYSAKRMLDETGCDLVMIGRACLGNPWLIKEINSYLEDNVVIDKPTGVDKIDMALKHLNNLKDNRTSKVAVLEIRNHIAWYLKGLDNSLEIKNKIFKETDIFAIIEILNDYRNYILEKENNNEEE